MRDDGQRNQQADGNDEPRTEDLGRRSFAGENIAADQRRQARERSPGTTTSRTNDQEDVSTAGLERDGNGDPLGGMTPEDDID